jgi:succinate dehydrogenase/fumarate reductase cytochrome b subunit
MYLLGWISARHVRRWWTGRLRRVSGGILAAIFALLTLTGFALFFISNDAWQHAAAAAHDVLGVAVTVIAIQHWFFARRRDIRSAASRPW